MRSITLRPGESITIGETTVTAVGPDRGFFLEPAQGGQCQDETFVQPCDERQARNTDAERKASEVRLRAERRTGELLKDLARAEAPNPDGLGGKSGKIVMSNDRTQQSEPQKSAPSLYAKALADTLAMHREVCGGEEHQ